MPDSDYCEICGKNMHFTSNRCKCSTDQRRIKALEDQLAREREGNVWYCRCEGYRVSLEKLADYLEIKGEQRGYENNADELISDATEAISRLKGNIVSLNKQAALVQGGSMRRWELLSDIYEKISAEIYPTND